MAVVTKDIVNIWAGPEDAVSQMAVDAAQWLADRYSCYRSPDPVAVRVYTPIEARVEMGRQDPGQAMEVTQHLTEHPDHWVVVAGLTLRRDIVN
jgi:hypothetical protein